MMKLLRLIVIAPMITYLGCASITVPKTAVNGSIENSRARMIPAEIPMPITTIQIYDANQKKRVEEDVLSLKPAVIRSRLTSTETLVSVEKRDISGSFTYLGSGGKVAKGSYKVTFDYANYTNHIIIFNDNKQAIGRIGVGLRITALLETTENGVDLSGLIPIGLAAQDQKISGQLHFLVYGMSNDKVSLAVPSQAILDVSAIQKSFEAAATVRILFGLEDTYLEPYLIGVADIAPADAKIAIEAATEQLVK